MKKLRTAIAILGGLVLASAGAVPAGAAETDTIDISGLQVEQGTPIDGPAFLLDEEGSMQPMTIDRTGETASPSRARAGCNWYRMAIPVGGAWHTSVDGCSLIGTTASAAHIYGWEVDPHSNGNPCMQGRGYTKVGSSWVANWVALGCGSAGAKKVTIGNVITTAKVKGQSIGQFGTALVFY